ncbi:apolipoprotein A-I-like [Cottoperca gobio]|uniref:Apolipoprotein A-I-like n=1 Tax=Cottoperca gobio TaxID=56716 RepID=A0A6J2QYP3_COTGO|nr:apolipoprotein A-I-like [Cottoperca gobio]
MKFVALALALLMAVGSHAAALQADSPSQLEHIKSAVDMSLEYAKHGAHYLLKPLDDPESREIKAKLTDHIENFFNQIQSLRDQPILVETIRPVITYVNNDIETMKIKLNPTIVELKDVIQKHADYYNIMFSPTLNAYYDANVEELKELKVTLDGIWQGMGDSVATNVEETKDKLIPIVTILSEKVKEDLERVKTIADLYVKEYSEQIVQAYKNSEMPSTPAFEQKSKLKVLAMNIKKNLEEMFKIATSTGEM